MEPRDVRMGPDVATECVGECDPACKGGGEGTLPSLPLSPLGWPEKNTVSTREKQAIGKTARLTILRGCCCCKVLLPVLLEMVGQASQQCRRA